MLFNESKILILKKITLLQTAQIKHQLHNNTLPPRIATCFNIHAITHHHNLRHPPPYRLPLPTSAATHNSILFLVHQLSPRIPDQFLNLKPNQFKKIIKNCYSYHNIYISIISFQNWTVLFCSSIAGQVDENFQNVWFFGGRFFSLFFFSFFLGAPPDRHCL